MINLFKSDFFRVVRSPFFWVLTAVVVAMIVAAAGMMAFIASPEFAHMVNEQAMENDPQAMVAVEQTDVPDDGLAASEDGPAASEDEPLNGKVLESITVTWGNTFLNGGLLGFVGSLFVALFLLADFKRGFVKNLPMDRRGRLAYYGEKVGFVAISQAFFLLVCAAASTASYAAFGFGYEHADSAGDVALWLLLAWLLCVAYALIVACLSWAFRSDALSSVASVVVSSGILGVILTQVFVRAASVMPVLGQIPQWLPVCAISDLRDGAAGLASNGAGFDFLQVSAAAHAAVVVLLVIAAACVIVFAACRRKDIA